MPSYLSRRQFLSVVRHTLLVSVDLVVVNAQGEALLGYRNNRPAQHTWFVPGGKILKNERIPEAMRRIARSELNLPLEVSLHAGGSVAQANLPVRFMDLPQTHQLAIELAEAAKLLADPVAQVRVMDMLQVGEQYFFGVVAMVIPGEVAVNAV